jgi:hypothetical protein
MAVVLGRQFKVGFERLGFMATTGATKTTKRKRQRKRKR